MKLYTHKVNRAIDELVAKHMESVHTLVSLKKSIAHRRLNETLTDADLVMVRKGVRRLLKGWGGAAVRRSGEASRQAPQKG
jgi:hypothetical protein